MRMILCIAIILSLTTPLLAQLPPDPVGNPVPSDKDIVMAKLGEAIGLGNFTLDGLTPRSDQSKELRSRFSPIVNGWAALSQEKKDAYYKTIPPGVVPGLEIQAILILEDGDDSTMNKLRKKAADASSLIQKTVQQIVDGKYVDAFMTATAACYAWPLVYDDLLAVVPQLDNVQYWMDEMQKVIDAK